MHETTVIELSFSLDTIVQDRNMIVLQRNSDRRHIRSGKSDMWLTFYPQENGEVCCESFGAISVLNEYMLPSNEGVSSELIEQTELVTYMHKGALAIEGATSHTGAITAGEFLCMTIIRVNHQDMKNRSHTDLAHFFRIYLSMQPTPLAIDKSDEQFRFTNAQRRNVLCTVVSPDSRMASLNSTTDTCIYSSLLDPGRHIVYALPPDRKAWLHIVYGKVTANDIDLFGGDGMGITSETSLSLTARESSELLLIDTTTESIPIERKETSR